MASTLLWDVNMQTRTFFTHSWLILIGLFILLFVVFTYTFLHEAGHALIGLLFGETLTEFSVRFWDLSAHVNMMGGELTQAQMAIQAVAGVGLPLSIWILFISLVPRNPGFILRMLKLLASMMVLNTLLAWIVIPVLYIFRSAPASDDVTHFLQSSGIPPLLLALVAVILYVLGWAYFLSRTEARMNELLLFRTTDRGTILSGARKTIPILTGILASCVVLALMLNNTAAALPDRFAPPADFLSIAEIDLTTRAYSFESLARFTLDEPTPVGIFIAVHDINTTYFDLCLIGSNGYSSVVLHGEGYRADQDGGLWEENLPPGIYQVMLTSDQSSGTATVFLKIHD
jgi:hypothetical protein